MQLEILRLNVVECASEDFFGTYFVPERPVILTGLEPMLPSGLGEKIWSLAQTGEAAGGNGYFSAPIGLGHAEVPVPKIVEQVFARDDIVHKPQPLRLWMQPEGHETGLHYDGNSLCGFNWHVAGRKRWLLLAPTRLLPMKPLTYLAVTPDGFEPSSRKYDVAEFVVEEGEMLFIPRYWAHRVTALGQVNANLNWVWTRKAPNRATPVGRRESATLKMRSLIGGRLDSLVEPRVPLHDYGDGGPGMFTLYTEQIGRAELLQFIAREFVNCLMLPLRARAVGRRQQMLAASNFHQSLHPGP